MIVPKSNGNPKLLDLLKMGAKVIFSDGRWLSGDPESGYIEFGYDIMDGESGFMGSYILNREGLEQVLSDRDWLDCVKENW